jgi:hypothetical protein
MALIEGSTQSPLSDEQRTEVAQLRRAARRVGGGLIVLLAAATAGMIILADEPRTDDMRKLAITAALAGLAGGSLGRLITLVGAVERGFTLNDGTAVLRGEEAGDYTRLRAPNETPSQPTGDQPTQSPPPDDDDSALPLIPGLSASGIASSMIYPLIGAVFGVVVFAGVVGGFLGASAGTGSYSIPALMFIAFLGGFFSDKFFERLSAASDTHFGTQKDTRPGASTDRDNRPS